MSNEQIEVLIADTWPAITESLNALLTTDPAFKRPSIAASPAATIERIKSVRPDLVLLDPAIGGEPEWEIITQIRQVSPGTIILIHGGAFSLEALFRAIEKGGHDLVAKGLPPRQLLRRLKMAVERHFLLNPAVARRLLAIIDEGNGRPPTDLPLNALDLAVIREVASYITINDIAHHLRLTNEQVFTEIDLVIGKIQHAFETGTRLIYLA